MYKLFLAVRYLRTRVIAYFAIAAVTLCVAMVLVVMSVMGGWLDQVMLRARGLLGDLVVDNNRYSGFPLYDEFIDEISDWPEIVRATPVIYSWGMFWVNDTSYNGTTRIVGIKLEEVFEVNNFEQTLFYHKYYPGTTTLAPQQQPWLGFGPPATVDGKLKSVLLPQPYASALEEARATHRERSNAPLAIDEEVPGDLNQILLEHNEQLIPGFYRSNGDDGPGLFGDELPGIIMGRDLVAQRESDGRYDRLYPRGARITLTSWAASLTGNVDPIPQRRVFRYTDDSRSGIYEIDSSHVYIDFDLLQQLLQMDEADKVNADLEVVGKSPARCSQIQIKADPTLTPLQLRDLADRLDRVYEKLLETHKATLDFDERRLVQHVDVKTWQESQAHVIGPVQKEKMLVTILFGIISLVAVALVLCILYMIVLQKTRDIGIIKAIGGSSAGVASIFVVYGAAVGLTGAVLGTILGTTFVWNINEIQDLLIQINPAWRVWDLKVYSFDRIPSDVTLSDALSVNIIAVIASMVGSLAAAWRAGRMHPVEAVRYE